MKFRSALLLLALGTAALADVTQTKDWLQGMRRFLDLAGTDSPLPSDQYGDDDDSSGSIVAGGWAEVETDGRSFRRAFHKALAVTNADPMYRTPFALENITRAEAQVVNGVNYRVNAELSNAHGHWDDHVFHFHHGLDDAITVHHHGHSH
jgi:hypothetical protein